MSDTSEAVGEDGSFTLRQVWPGKNKVAVSGGNPYVKSMQLGPTTLEGAQLDLSNGSGGAALTVRLAVPKGAVTGVVRGAGGTASGAVVILSQDVPGRGPIRTTSSKEDGSYAFTGIAPGKYRIFATDESAISFWLGSEASADEFDKTAEKIEVHDGETVSRDLNQQQK